MGLWEKIQQVRDTCHRTPFALPCLLLHPFRTACSPVRLHPTPLQFDKQQAGLAGLAFDEGELVIAAQFSNQPAFKRVDERLSLDLPPSVHFDLGFGTGTITRREARQSGVSMHPNAQPIWEAPSQRPSYHRNRPPTCCARCPQARSACSGT